MRGRAAAESTGVHAAEVAMTRLLRPYAVPAGIGIYAAAIALARTPQLKLALCAPLVAIPVVVWTALNARAWIALFFASALLLPPLPIPIGDSGPHPALLVALLGVCAGLVRLPQWHLRRDALSLAMLALFFILLASVIGALLYSGPWIAAGSLARVFLFGIGIYLFFYTAQGPADYAPADADRAVRFLLAAACASAAFACIDFYFQFPAPAGYGPQFVWLDSGVFRRAQGLFYEASTLGNLCACFLVMIAICLLRKGGWMPCSRRTLGLCGIVFAFALVFSYSRASLLNVIVAICAYACLERPRIGRAFLIVSASIAAAAIVAIAAAPDFAQMYWMRLASTAEYLFTSPEGVLSGRLASWSALADFLRANPWHAILGIGYKTLPYSDYAGRPLIADNMYLSLLVETGIVGLTVFALFNVAVLRAAKRAARNSSARTAFFGRWIFCFWIGQMVQMLSGDLLTYWRVLPVYFWLLAMAVRNADPVRRSV